MCCLQKTTVQSWSATAQAAAGACRLSACDKVCRKSLCRSGELVFDVAVAHTLEHRLPRPVEAFRIPADSLVDKLSKASCLPGSLWKLLFLSRNLRDFTAVLGVHGTSPMGVNFPANACGCAWPLPLEVQMPGPPNMVTNLEDEHLILTDPTAQDQLVHASIQFPCRIIQGCLSSLVRGRRTGSQRLLGNPRKCGADQRVSGSLVHGVGREAAADLAQALMFKRRK